MRGTHWLGGLNFRAFFLNTSRDLIILFISIICTNKQRNSVGSVVLGASLRAWFDPQVPTFVHIILFHEIRYTAASSVHHMPSRSNHQTHLQPRSNAFPLNVYHTPQVNVRTRSGEVKRAGICFGPEFQHHTPRIVK